MFYSINGRVIVNMDNVTSILAGSMGDIYIHLVSGKMHEVPPDLAQDFLSRLVDKYPEAEGMLSYVTS